MLCLVPPRSFLAWLTPPRPNLTFHSATLCHLRETSLTDSKQQTTYSPSDPSLLCSDVIWSLLNAQCLGNHLIPCGCLTKVCGVDGCCFPGSCLVSVRYRLRSGAHTAILSTPNPAEGHHQATPPLETPGHSQASLGQSLVGSLLLSPFSL